jgi:hypothetical protein
MARNKTGMTVAMVTYQSKLNVWVAVLCASARIIAASMPEALVGSVLVCRQVVEESSVRVTEP